MPVIDKHDYLSTLNFSNKLINLYIRKCSIIIDLFQVFILDFIS